MNVGRLARQRGWDSLIIVTEPYHARRASRTFHTFLPETTIYVSPSPDDDFNPDRWWQDEHSLISVIDETLKLGFYWINYGIAPV